MSVMHAEAAAPIARVVATSRVASERAESRVFMNAPLPHFRRNGARALGDIFLELMLLTMNSSNSTVDVTSRSE
jgi:hypothetical protein